MAEASTFSVSGERAPLVEVDDHAPAVALQRSTAFWESALRRKKPASWKVQEMKVLLEMLGIDTKGKKVVLCERVKEHLFGLDDACGEAAPVCVVKIKFPEAGWKSFVDVAPTVRLKFDMGSVYSYFVARKEGDGLSADNFRSISSHSYGLYTKAYCRDGEMAVSPDTSTLFIRCFCKAEMKTAERYRIEMALTSIAGAGKPFDSLSYATCQCKAGLGPAASCKHIAAVCYGLDEYTRRQVFTGITSCTSELQKWNAPPAKRRVADMDFAALKFGGRLCPRSDRAKFDPRPEAKRAVDPGKEQRFLRDLLAECSQVQSAMLDTLPGPDRKATNPPPERKRTLVKTIPELIRVISLSSPAGEMEAPAHDQLLINAKLSKAEVHAIEYQTRGQASNSLWPYHSICVWESGKVHCTLGSFGSATIVQPSVTTISPGTQVRP